MLPKSLIPWRARKAAKELAQQVAKYSAEITKLRWNATTVHANLAGSAMAGMNSLAVTKEILRAAGYQPPAEPDPVPVETDAPKPPTPPKQGGATANARFTLEQEAAADGVARLLGYLPRCEPAAGESTQDWRL